MLHQMYLISVRTRVASWNVERRYREIYELHHRVGNLQYVCQFFLHFICNAKASSVMKGIEIVPFRIWDLKVRGYCMR